MKKLIAMLFLCVLLTSGCAVKPAYHVFVNSINNGTVIEGKACYIGPASKDVTADDLTFKEYSAYVRKALEKRGYTIAENTDNADLLILLGYTIGGPQSNTTSMPIFGQTGISSSRTYGTINSYSSGYSTYSGTTNYTPTYGITGAVPVTYTTYTRYIKMTAYDWSKYKTEKKEVMLWETDIVSSGSSGDLRRVFPVMMAGSIPYIGTNTGQKVKVVLDENSQEVLLIKGLTVE